MVSCRGSATNRNACWCETLIRCSVDRVRAQAPGTSQHEQDRRKPACFAPRCAMIEDPSHLRRAGLEDVGVASFSTDTPALLLWSLYHLMDGITQRNQQHTPPLESGDVSTLLIMGSHAPEHDWTEDLPKTDHVCFFRETDWSKSSLGPLNTWSSTLRLFTGFVLADSRAACLWWYVNGTLSTPEAHSRPYLLD
jgi:hypothetical protein